MKIKSIKIRSAFSSGINLGGSVHKTNKGKGSYCRKPKYGNKWE